MILIQAQRKSHSVHYIKRNRFHKAKINLVKNNFLSCKKRTAPIRYNITNENDIQKENNTILKSGKAKDKKILRNAIATWMKENSNSSAH